MAGVYNGTQLIKDVETGSLWNHITGEAIHGALEGGALERIALAQCGWQEWLEMIPIRSCSGSTSDCAKALAHTIHPARR
jgi:hypothetical protein